jgi:hypothetical protein
MTPPDQPSSGCRGAARAGAVLLLIAGALLIVAGRFEQFNGGGGWYGGIAGWIGLMYGALAVCLAIAIWIVLKMSE